MATKIRDNRAVAVVSCNGDSAAIEAALAGAVASASSKVDGVAEVEAMSVAPYQLGSRQFAVVSVVVKGVPATLGP